MLRVALVVLAGLLLLLGAWLFLRGEPAADVGPAVGRTSGSAPDTAAHAEPDLVPSERAIAIDVDEAEPVPPAVAVPEPGTGVLAGRLVIDGAPLTEAIELQLFPADREGLEATRGALRTDAFGRFRREGLPADWSGSLGLPVPYSVGVSADIWSWNQTVPIAELREDLVIEVVRSPALRFRVLHADRTPAADVTARVEQHETGGWAEDMATTDAQGRVCMRQSNARPHAVVVHARNEDGANVSASFRGDALLPSGPYGDIDLGDLALARGREVELRCVEADGAPVAGTQARIFADKVSLNRTTNADGVFRIGLPLARVDLKVDVVGYLRADTVIAEGQSHIEIVLRPASLLRVEVTDTVGRPWANGRICVVATRSLFEAGVYSPPGFKGRLSSRLQTSPEGQVEHALEIDLDADGAVELSGIVAGLEFELQVRDQLGHVAVRNRQAGLADGERRVARLQREREPCALEVRVIDVAGTPLPGAEVKLRSEVFTISDNTGADGSIRFENLFSLRLDVSAHVNGLQEVWMEAVDPCAGLVTVTLMEGRTLSVELRDEAGRAVEAGRLELRDLSGERKFQAGGTPRRFEDLPFEPLVLVWTYCGTERRLEVDAAQTSAELVVPTLGEVQVAVEGWTPVEREFLYLTVESLDGPRPGCGSQSLGATGQRVPLLPGRYRLAASVTRVDRESGPEERPFGAPREIVVEPGTTQDITLGP
jgi:hypothetical protein